MNKIKGKITNILFVFSYFRSWVVADVLIFSDRSNSIGSSILLKNNKKYWLIILKEFFNIQFFLNFYFFLN